jgi:hypothetical protein
MDRPLRPSAAHNDEPTVEDRLGRAAYADALARLAEHCDTPFVIGLYGAAGIGKTSLMRLIDTRLDRQTTPTVWFDAWLHQSGGPPALAVLHAVADACGLGAGARRSLGTIAAALGAAAPPPPLAAGLHEVERLRRRLDEERWEAERARIHVREHVEALVGRALGSGAHAARSRLARLLAGRDARLAGRRLVVFVDHLDRCAAPAVASLLDALTLHLNVRGCVYLLAMDRQAIEPRLADGGGHLERVVQLPFSIPPIARECMDAFVGPLLSPRLGRCRPLLVAGLGDGPRQVKRFVNHLALIDELAVDLGIECYDPVVLALLLLVRSRSLPLYRLVEGHPETLTELVEGRAGEILLEPRLRAAFEAARTQLPADAAVVARHLRLVHLTRAEGREPLEPLPVREEPAGPRWPEYLGRRSGGPGDPPAAIRSCLDLLAERFDPEVVPDGHPLILDLHLSGDGGGSWCVEIVGRRCRVVEGTDRSPHASISASDADFLDLTSGRLGPREALAAGRLDLRGDGEVVRELTRVLGLPEELGGGPPALGDRT